MQFKWIAIAGSWRNSAGKVEKKVREKVKQIVQRGDGIISGGALGVDFFALDEALKYDQKAEKIKIFLPTSLKIYKKHFFKRAKEGVITKDQAEELIEKLEFLKKINPKALDEDEDEKIVSKGTYFKRNQKIVDHADRLIAFWVNQSSGTGDAIDRARKKGILVKIYRYHN
jgi:DNA helicase HerA-like ATPase